MPQVIHCFKDGSSDPSAKVVPARIMIRLDQILVEAQERQKRKNQENGKEGRP